MIYQHLHKAAGLILLSFCTAGCVLFARQLYLGGLDSPARWIGFVAAIISSILFTTIGLRVATED